MKTSSQLFLLLIFGLLLTLFSFNKVLVDRFTAGKFDKRIDLMVNAPQYVRVALPQARHLVIDAAVHSGDNQAKRSPAYRPDRIVSVNVRAAGNYVEVQRELAPFFKSIRRGDTLYLGFYHKTRVNSINFEGFGGEAVKIVVSGFRSFSLSNGSYNLWGDWTEASMEVEASHATANVNNTRGLLSVTARNLSTITVGGGARGIDCLTYSLAGDSQLNVIDATIAKSYVPLQVERGSHITVSGEASLMQPLLKEMGSEERVKP